MKVYIITDTGKPIIELNEQDCLKHIINLEVGKGISITAINLTQEHIDFMNEMKYEKN